MGHGLDLAPEMRQLNYLSVGIPGLFLAHDLKISLSVSFFSFSTWFSYFTALMAVIPQADHVLSVLDRGLSLSHIMEKSEPKGNSNMWREFALRHRVTCVAVKTGRQSVSCSQKFDLCAGYECEMIHDEVLLGVCV